MTAEFYDLLHASSYHATATALIDRWFDEPAVGVIDAGAGTGLATAVLAGRCHVTVHAVEPSPSMRAVLLSRLAGRPALLSHVRVYDRPVQHLGLHRAADFTLCLNMMASLDPIERGSALTALATAMVRGGTLVVQRPPDTPNPARSTLPTWQLGGDEYGGDVTCTATGPATVEWCFTYRVRRGDVVLRELSETFPGHLVSPAEFDAELRAAGFMPVDSDQPDIVIAKRIG